MLWTLPSQSTCSRAFLLPPDALNGSDKNAGEAQGRADKLQSVRRHREEFPQEKIPSPGDTDIARRWSPFYTGEEEQLLETPRVLPSHILASFQIWSSQLFCISERKIAPISTSEETSAVPWKLNQLLGHNAATLHWLLSPLVFWKVSCGLYHIWQMLWRKTCHPLALLNGDFQIRTEYPRDK